MLNTRISLRIIGEFNSEDISEELGLSPSYVNRKGEKDRFGEIFDSDIWVITSPLGKSESPQKHLEWFVEQFENRYDILRKIKNSSKIDIFCGLTSIDQSGFSLSPKTLSIFQDLEINLEVSLILLSDG